jgi:hypothetical protein
MQNCDKTKRARKFMTETNETRKRKTFLFIRNDRVGIHKRIGWIGIDWAQLLTEPVTDGRTTEKDCFLFCKFHLGRIDTEGERHVS